MKAIVSLLVVAAACHAPPAAKPQPSAQLGPGLEKLAFYVGDWACDGVGYDAQGKPNEHASLIVRVRPAFGSWLEITVWKNGKQLTTELKGWEAETKKFHHIWATPEGAWGSLTSPDWDGDHLVFEDDHPDPKARGRMTFKLGDDTHYTHRAEVDEGAGYRLDYEKTCRKT
jgi:hypothetical protein